MGIGFLVGIAPIGEIHVITIVLVYWGIWCLGAFLADVYVGRTCLTLGNISLMSILLIIMPIADHAFSLSGGNIQIGLIRELLWGIGFMGLIAAALTWKRQGGSLVLLEYLKPFGNFSYTLYVLHLPILVFISAYLQAKNSTLPRFFEWVILGVVLVNVISYLAYFIVEKPFTSSKLLSSRPLSEANQQKSD